jgi:hypothetical protein
MADEHHGASKYGENDSKYTRASGNREIGICNCYSGSFPRGDRRITKRTILGFQYDTGITEETLTLTSLEVSSSLNTLTLS